MESVQIILVLMAFAILLVGLAQKLGWPYPIALVIGGMFISFIPGIKLENVDPNLLFVLLVPPILHYAAFWFTFTEFKKYWFDIFSLAFGLVLATTAVVAILFKALFPDLSWELAIAFGALVSPPDAVTVTTILKRFAISPRLLTILEGESLVNDATALVIYRLAVFSLASGTFTWEQGLSEFFKIGLGGVLIGVLAGLTLQRLSSLTLNPVVGVLFSFIVPYMTFILADSLGVSGILAVVINGLFSSYWVIRNQAGLRRILGAASWDIFIILLNCFVFIMIGLNLQVIASEMTLEQKIKYSAYGLLFTAAIILVRLVWVFLQRTLIALRSSYQKKSLWQEEAVIGWSGMRGIVSLTAALALPFSIQDGRALEGRGIVIFLTFVVILLSLLIPGMTLSSLLRLLKLHYLQNPYTLHRLRKRLLKSAEDHIETLQELSDEDRLFLKNYFQSRHRLLAISSTKYHRHQILEEARQKIIQNLRQELLKMWEDKEIEDKILKVLELELDIEETLNIRGEV